MILIFTDSGNLSKEAKARKVGKTLRLGEETFWKVKRTNEWCSATLIAIQILIYLAAFIIGRQAVELHGFDNQSHDCLQSTPYSTNDMKVARVAIVL